MKVLQRKIDGSEWIESKNLYYKSGYKYITQDHFMVVISVSSRYLPRSVIFKPQDQSRLTLQYYESNFLRLSRLKNSGKCCLFISKGYAWDGISGGRDTKKNMIPSLVHDALYQLIREGALSKSFRKNADDIFRDLGKRMGANLVSGLYYRIVRLFGSRAASEKGIKGVKVTGDLKSR